MDLFATAPFRRTNSLCRVLPLLLTTYLGPCTPLLLLAVSNKRSILCSQVLTSPQVPRSSLSCSATFLWGFPAQWSLFLCPVLVLPFLQTFNNKDAHASSIPKRVSSLPTHLPSRQSSQRMKSCFASTFQVPFIPYIKIWLCSLHATELFTLIDCCM